MMAPFLARRLTVLVYHRVLREHDPLRPGEPTTEAFEARMRWLAEAFAVLPLADAVQALAAGRLPRRAACITFDDGYADNHEIALPILRRLGLPATFFVASGYLDGGCMFNDLVIESLREAPPPVLDLVDLGLGRHALVSDAQRRDAAGRILERLKYVEPERRDALAREIAERCMAPRPGELMMSAAQVRALHEAGMSIGAHTVSHPVLAEIPLHTAREEIAQGRSRLEAITGAPVRLFAYPNGKPVRDYGPEHVALVRELGFAAAVSTAWGAARAGDDPFQIPRFTPWDRPNWRFALRIARSHWLTPAAA